MIKVFGFTRYSLAQIVSISLLVPCYAHAEDLAKQGFYIGAAVGKASLTGSVYDGTTIYSNSVENLDAPEVSDGNSQDIILGYRTQNYAFELNHSKSTHDVLMNGVKGSADYENTSLDVRRFYLTDNQFQPYALIGVILHNELTLEKGAYRTATPAVRYTGRYTGYLGYNLGFGVAYYPVPSIAINAAYVARFAKVHTAEAKETVGASMDGADGRGSLLAIGLTYTF